MKQLAYGVLALIVPVLLGVYGMNAVGMEVVFLFCGGFMLLGTSFVLAGVKKGAYTETEAFWRIATGNTIALLFYLALIFMGARILEPGFDPNPARFAPLMLGVSYAGLLAIIICAIRLVKNEWLDGWHKAQTWAAMGFALSIMFACISAALKSYGVMVPDMVSKFALQLLIVSCLGISICGYKFTVYDIKHPEHC